MTRLVESSAAPAVRPTRRARLLVAVALALLAGAYTQHFFVSGPLDERATFTDFAYQYYGARALWTGGNPYTDVGPHTHPNLNVAPLHPAPALVFIGPWAWLPLGWATSAFAAVSTLGFAYAVTARQWLPLAAVLSWPFLLTLLTAQWSLLLTAAAVLAPLAWLAPLKPHIGLAMAVYQPTRRWFLWAAGGAAVLTAIAFVLQPGWVPAWLAALRTRPASSGADGPDAMAYYLVPAARSGGIVLLAALARWRRPEARLLAALAVIPQTPIGYELLPLLALVPATLRQAVVLAAGSWIVFAVTRLPLPGLHTPTTLMEMFVLAARAQVWAVYVPCLVLVLRRPNVGRVPAGVERALVRWRVPGALAGEAGPSERAA